MINKKQETIADIVADIRAQNQGLPEDSYALSPLVCDLLSFADRIEKAYKRLSLPTPEQWTEIARQSVEIYDLKRENDILRAALKPVLDVYISQDDPSVDVYDSRLDSAFALKSVREAKRIYKEGCDK